MLTKKESIKDLYKKNNQTSKNCVKIINVSLL